MRRFGWTAVLVLLVAPAFSQQTLVFEAEEVSTPTDAWVTDQMVPNKWNLWTKDSDAAKKWSGGKVLQSAPVTADREKPEDGAPVLHTVLTKIPRGTWAVTIKYARGLAVSLDNKTWRRLSELDGKLGRFDIQDGKFEFWVDDRYAEQKSPGSCYYDSITLTPVMPERSGVVNGDFEFGADLRSSGWAFWSRDGGGSAELVPDGHTGRGLRITHTAADKDWAVTNGGRLAVKPGQAWQVSAWLKCQDSKGVDLTIAAFGQGKIITWSMASEGISGTTGWTRIEATGVTPKGADEIQIRVVGFGQALAWVDEVALRPGPPPPAPKPRVKVNGWAKQRVTEKLGRGVIALPLEGGKTYVGWRLLAEDPAGVAFNVYRAIGRGRSVKLNDAPVARTTDFVDEQPVGGMDSRYWVHPVVNGMELPASEQAGVAPRTVAKPYVSIKLQGDYAASSVGVGDLDGDGQLDYVIKQPAYSIDPYGAYWHASKDTYKLEAYRSDGTFLWRVDLGWGIEEGIWYAPYLVYDFDGDGKAEVAAKTSEGDPRDPDGHVTGGPEYVTVFDGTTGRPKARTEWIPRGDFGRGSGAYNFASRNQLGVAYLDGKTPCLLLARGTYTVMKVKALQLNAGKLDELWSYDSREEGPEWAGQGAHWMHTGDVDEDGRDEVLLGSVALDDDGKGLWNLGLGHPDFFFLGDLDPSRPGLEVTFSIEPGRKQNGVCMADARTGQILWGLGQQSYHVGMGMTADIDPTHPGCEVWAGEDGKGDPQGKNYGGAAPRWLFSAKGEMIARDAAVPAMTAIYWDADSQREVVPGSRVQKYRGQILTQGIEGNQIAWGDFLGDWREEIITSVKGELRIYSTTIPATDRRTCLLQDPIYRHDVAHVTMGYPKPPTPGRFIAQLSPAMWMTTSRATLKFGEPVQAKLVIAAAAGQPTRGTVRLEAPAGLTVAPTTLALDVPAGQLREAAFTVALKTKPAQLSALDTYVVKAILPGTAPLQSQVSLRREDVPLADALLAQAEDFAGQGGGEVKIRDDKVGSMGKAFSHWDTKDHWLSWKLRVPTAGKYLLVLRYCTPQTVQRRIEIDGGAPIVQAFPGTGGFGGPDNDWAHFVVRDPGQRWLGLELAAGEHTIKLTNVDGRGLNLDYLALVAMK